MKLDPAAIRTGMRLEAHDVLPSTNGAALERARAGERGPLWITAGRQSAGRGRHGRHWVSEPGNLYATLLLTDPSPAERAAELSFVAALSVHDAILDVAPPAFVAHCAVHGSASRVSIKWPNDLLLDGAKVAGVLIEGEAAAEGAAARRHDTVADDAPADRRRYAVAIGIGINCTHHPVGVAYPATDLATSGIAVSSDTLFSVLSRTMAVRLAQWAHGGGFASVRSDWLARAAALGGRLRAVLGDHVTEGTFETLDDSGRLVLRLADGGRKVIAAGDVLPLDAAGERKDRPVTAKTQGPTAIMVRPA